jgi:uncharacterized protein (TIGR02466 family)
MKKVETENMYAMFGTPLYSNFFPRDFNELEKKTLLNLEFRNNEGNYTSIDNFVLNRIELAEIKNFIETSLIECFNTVYSPPPNTCEIYLTQSWVNYTTPGGYHHKHNHSNSFMSGVIYIDVEDEKDSIIFFRPNHEFIQLSIMSEKWNEFNALNWRVPIKTKQLILFPSNIQHSVGITDSSNKQNRVSLSFNSFIKGTIGTEEGLAWVKI